MKMPSMIEVYKTHYPFPRVLSFVRNQNMGILQDNQKVPHKSKSGPHKVSLLIFGDRYIGYR